MKNTITNHWKWKQMKIQNTKPILLCIYGKKLLYFKSTKAQILQTRLRSAPCAGWISYIKIILYILCF